MITSHYSETGCLKKIDELEKDLATALKNADHWMARKEKFARKNVQLNCQLTDALEKAEHWQEACIARFESGKQSVDDCNTLQKENVRLMKELDSARDAVVYSGGRQNDLANKLSKQAWMTGNIEEEKAKYIDAVMNLREAMAEIRELWKGCDGYITETCPNEYLKSLLIQGYEIAEEALKG